MTNSVSRLKELLFDSEAQTLAALSERLDALVRVEGQKHTELLDALRQISQAEKTARDEIIERLDAVFSRAGTNDYLESSVAQVFDGVLRKAEQDRYDAVTTAVSPFVVKTVQTEIANSQDALVEALYPMTGRMVKAYVASAIKDLSDQINRRLETNPVMLYMRSFATGRPVSELAIADAQRLEVEELYLIRRGTGELLGHWPAVASGANRDQVMSGVLTAINEFASEAFSADGSALRQIDLGGHQVYLRVSPAYLLAAKCSGTAPVAVEAVVDDAFLGTIEALGKSGSMSMHPEQNQRLLSALSTDLEKRIAERQEDVSGRSLGVSPLKMLAWIFGVPLVAWLGWSLYGDYQTERVRAIAADVLATSSEIKGYPTRLEVARQGRSLTLTGLVPTQSVRNDVTNRLRTALPGVLIHDEIAVVPSALAQVEPEIEKLKVETAQIQPEIGKVRSDINQLENRLEKATLTREIEHSRRLLAQAKSELSSLQPSLERESKGLSARIAKDLDDGIAKLSAQRAAAEASTAAQDVTAIQSVLDATAGKVRKTGQELAGLLTVTSGTLTPPAISKAGTAVESAEQLTTDSERLSMTLVALTQAFAVKNSIPPPAAAPPPPPAPVVASPRERLEAWTRANAIFYANESEYREPRKADQALDDLADLMKGTGILVRVVGYTDQQGTAGRNTPLSQSRAEKVMTELMTRGIPQSQLVAVGRIYSRDISASLGANSPNRRVEFEVGFEGERAP